MEAILTSIVTCRRNAAKTSVLVSAQSEVEPHREETGELGEQQKYKATSPPRLSKNHHTYERHQKVGRRKRLKCTLTAPPVSSVRYPLIYSSHLEIQPQAAINSHDRNRRKPAAAGRFLEGWLSDYQASIAGEANFLRTWETERCVERLL
ncbi:hypothetical protein HFO74_22790 [Rhizobium laguerreae]|uniref:Uncharacterized protein n=1 Tax=Rhizobium laguerreae TaxID=1076926 RepID=A0AB35FHJ6_9HYPH|nr:hypothetical protein [Rhizobium laguerreae]MBY3066211.1 hypothetical protein [Rhizobium laguerreae]MBY3114160.1 hypothetical protein [Rhizobium laguerreae]MBY3302073.1 hypothetical protein [Rhizobium laguerreae]